MINKEQIIKLSFVLSLMIIILLVWDGCTKRAELSAFKDSIAKLNIGEQHFTETINEQGNRIAEQEQIILSQKDAIQNNMLVIKNLKSVESQVKIENVLSIDSVFIPYTDTLIKYDTIRFYQRKFNLTNPYFYFSGITKKDGVFLDSVSFQNKLDITIGQKKMGFLKKPKPIVSVEYTNPYIRTTSLNNVVIKENLKWYQKRGVWFSVGVLSGFVGGILIK